MSSSYSAMEQLIDLENGLYLFRNNQKNEALKLFKKASQKEFASSIFQETINTISPDPTPIDKKNQLLIEEKITVTLQTQEEPKKFEPEKKQDEEKTEIGYSISPPPSHNPNLLLKFWNCIVSFLKSMLRLICCMKPNDEAKYPQYPRA